MTPPPDVADPQSQSYSSSSAFESKTNDSPDINSNNNNNNNNSKKKSSTNTKQNFISIYLSDSTLEKYSMKKGIGINEIVEWKVIKLSQIKQEIQQLGLNSDFNEFRELFQQQYEGEYVLFIKGPENEFDTNYKFSSSMDVYEDVIKQYNNNGDDNGENMNGEKSNDNNNNNNNNENNNSLLNDENDDESSAMSTRNKKSRGLSAMGSNSGRNRKYQMDNNNDNDNEDGSNSSNSTAAVAGSQWIEYSTEQEIQLSHIKSHRPLVGYYISQPRYKFGRIGSALEFSDVEPNDKLSEYGRQKIPNYSLNRSIQHVGFQAANEINEISTQTEFSIKINKSTQSKPIEYRNEQCKELMNSNEIKELFSTNNNNNSTNHYIQNIYYELNKNILLDLFKDEFIQFHDEEINIGNRAENSIEILHSFHHLKYSKNKYINSIQWLNNNQNNNTANNNNSNNIVNTVNTAANTSPLVAFSASPSWNYEEYIEQSGKINFSYILLYSLKDLLHPQLILEIPGQIKIFKFHPHNMNWVIVGLQSGQILYYDLTEDRNRMMEENIIMNKKIKINQNNNNSNNNDNKDDNKESTNSSSSTNNNNIPLDLPTNNNNNNSIPSTSSASSSSLPVIRYTYISYIDRSHSRPVTDLYWLPADRQVTRRGEYYSTPISTQFASIAADGRWMCWDFKNRNEIRPGGSTSLQYQAEQEAAQKILQEKRSKENQSVDPINTMEGRVVTTADSTGNSSNNTISGGGINNSSSTTTSNNLSAAIDADVELKEIKWAPTFVLPLNRAPNPSNENNDENNNNDDNKSPNENNNSTNPNTMKSTYSTLTGPFTATKMHYYEKDSFVMVSEDGEIALMNSSNRGPAAVANNNNSTNDSTDRMGSASSLINKSEPVSLILRGHLRSAVGVDRSPHYPNIFLTVGDWSFAIWQIGLTEPIFVSSPAPDSLRCARFSPTRPGLIVAGRSDGSIDFWDFCDQTHRPTNNFQTGVADAIHSLEFHNQIQSITGNNNNNNNNNNTHNNNNQSQSQYFIRQYLAAGDEGGKLHIIEMPRNLRKRIHNEEILIKEFYMREIKKSKQKGLSRKMAQQQQQTMAAAAAAASVAANNNNNNKPSSANSASLNDNNNNFGNTTTSLMGSNNKSHHNNNNNNSINSHHNSHSQHHTLELNEDEKSEREYQLMLKEFREKLSKEGEI